MNKLPLMINCLLVLILTTAFAHEAEGQMFKVYWKNFQLTSAGGVPDGNEHTYRMSGTFLVTDAPTSSWNDSIPLLNSGGDDFVAVREEVFMEVKASWRADTNEAVELITLTYEGGIQGELKSTFKCSVDPFLSGARCIVENSLIKCDADNIQVPVGNGLTEERYPFFDLTGLVRGGQHPLSGGRVSKQKATQLSANSGSGTTPPPPAPATTNLRVTGDWLSPLGQFNLEQTGTRLLGTCVNEEKQAFLVKGEIVNDRMQLSLSRSGNVRWVLEGLATDAQQSRFRGRVSKRVNGRAGLSSSIELTRKLNIVVMTPTNPGGQGGTGGNSDAGAGTPTTANISGKWDSNLGKVSLTQDGNSVKGELVFANGITAVMSGTMTGRDYNFQWGIGGQTLGTGHLNYKNNNRTLKGTYTDNRIGQPTPFRLTRE